MAPRALRLGLDGLVGLAAAGLGLALLSGGHAVGIGAMAVGPPSPASAAIVLAGLGALRLGLLARPGVARDAVLIVALLSIAYLANHRTTASGDTVPASYLPFSVLRHGTFYLDEFALSVRGCLPYFLRLVDGHHVSAYPVGAALAALPFYVLPVLGGVPPSTAFVSELEKLAAAILVALSAAVLYVALRNRVTRGMALFIVAAYGLGSSSFSVSSQALWQHGPAQLVLAIALWALLRDPARPGSLGLAGLALGAGVVCRPSVALLAVPLGIFVLLTERRRAVWFVAGAIPPLAFLVWYNQTYFHDAFHLQWSPSDPTFRATPFRGGLAGLLVSPGRGLLVYSPVFVLGFAGLLFAWRRGGDGLLRAGGVGVALTLLVLGRWEMWWGGATYGPRLLADVTPVLALAMAPLGRIITGSAGWRGVAVALLAWSVGVHAVGVFAHDFYWNAYRDVDRFPEHLWSWTDNQVVNPFKQVLGRAVIARGHVPTSRDAPEAIRASFLGGPSTAKTVTTSSAIELSLEIANEGPVVWLAWPRRADGVVGLAWRWRASASERGPGPDAGGVRMAPVVAPWSGGLPLYRDVFPGERYRAGMASIQAPGSPGAYELEVALIVHRRGCVVEIPGAAIRMAVGVRSPVASADGPDAPTLCGRSLLAEALSPC